MLAYKVHRREEKGNKKRNNHSTSGLLYFTLVFGIRLFPRHCFCYVRSGSSFNFRAFLLFVVWILFTHIILTQPKQSICIFCCDLLEISNILIALRMLDVEFWKKMIGKKGHKRSATYGNEKERWKHELRMKLSVRIPNLTKGPLNKCAMLVHIHERQMISSSSFVCVFSLISME